jgi:hypothetical protein
MQDEIDFPTILAASLLADYFLISGVVLPDGEGEFQLQTPLAPHYSYFTRTWAIERDMYDSVDGTWVQMVFSASDGKATLSERFEEVNFVYRMNAGLVLMPDIYGGSGEPKQEIWDPYLGRIVEFFASNRSARSYAEFNGVIHIPIKGEGGPREYAVYSANAFHGVVRG